MLSKYYQVEGDRGSGPSKLGEEELQSANLGVCCYQTMRTLNDVGNLPEIFMCLL